MLTPESLETDDRSVREIVNGIVGQLSSESPGLKTLIVVDAYHSRMFSGGDTGPQQRVAVVKDNSRARVDEIRAEGGFDQVIGVGTCTALDMAKAIGDAARPVIIVPAILSTACISIDKSVIKEKEGSRAVLSQLPVRTIVPVRAISEIPYALKKRTSASGFGDILARFGAAVDVAFKSEIPLSLVLKEIPDTTEVLDWILSDFADYNEACILKLAQFSHLASIVTIHNRERGRADLNVGSEHALYYWLVDHFPLYRSTRYTGWLGSLRYRFDTWASNQKIPTHGEIVAIGTLMLLRLEAEASGDFEVFNRMKIAFGKLGLPINQKQLKDISMDFSQLIQGMKGVAQKRSGGFSPAVESLDFGFLERTFPK